MLLGETVCRHMSHRDATVRAVAAAVSFLLSHGFSITFSALPKLLNDSVEVRHATLRGLRDLLLIANGYVCPQLPMEQSDLDGVKAYVTEQSFHEMLRKHEDKWRRREGEEEEEKREEGVLVSECLELISAISLSPAQRN